MLKLIEALKDAGIPAPNKDTETYKIVRWGRNNRYWLRKFNGVRLWRLRKWHKLPRIRENFEGRKAKKGQGRDVQNDGAGQAKVNKKG